MPDEASRMLFNFLYFSSSELNISTCFPIDMEGDSPVSQQQVIVNSTSTDYNGLPTESASSGAPEETCTPFSTYDYATNIRLANGYKFTSGGGPTNTGGYPSYPTSNTPPATSHQVRFKSLTLYSWLLF